MKAPTPYGNYPAFVTENTKLQFDQIFMEKAVARLADHHEDGLMLLDDGFWIIFQHNIARTDTTSAPNEQFRRGSNGCKRFAGCRACPEGNVSTGQTAGYPPGTTKTDSL